MLRELYNDLQNIEVEQRIKAKELYVVLFVVDKIVSKDYISND